MYGSKISSESQFRVGGVLCLLLSSVPQSGGMWSQAAPLCHGCRAKEQAGKSWLLIYILVKVFIMFPADTDWEERVVLLLVCLSDKSQWLLASLMALELLLGLSISPFTASHDSFCCACWKTGVFCARRFKKLVSLVTFQFYNPYSVLLFFFFNLFFLCLRNLFFSFTLAK